MILNITIANGKGTLDDAEFPALYMRADALLRLRQRVL
jgi:hypothetical protein